MADAPAAGEGVSCAPMRCRWCRRSGAALRGGKAALAGAKRPVIIAGVDAVEDQRRGRRSFWMRRRRWVRPVITTYKGKGLIPEDHPLALGGAGLSPKADKILLPLVAGADVVLGAGYDPIEMRPGWQNAFDPARQVVIDITAAPNHHYMHQATHNMIGSVAETLRAICPRRAGIPGPRGSRPG